MGPGRAWTPANSRSDDSSHAKCHTNVRQRREESDTAIGRFEVAFTVTFRCRPKSIVFGKGRGEAGALSERDIAVPPFRSFTWVVVKLLRLDGEMFVAEALDLLG